MTHTKILVAAAVVAAGLAVAPSAQAQGRSRGGRPAAASRGVAVPRPYARGPVRVIRPQIVTVAPYRPYYYYPRYRGGVGVNLGFYYGYPYGYAYPYAYGYPYQPYAYPPYSYPYPAYGSVAVRPYGGLRLDIQQRDAEVYVDGYFAGVVDQYDGVFQQLNLEAGPHHVEVRAPGFEPVAFDINVEPGRTITYRASLLPDRP